MHVCMEAMQPETAESGFPFCLSQSEEGQDKEDDND